MLTFLQYILLTENRVEFLKQQHAGGIDTEHDTLALHRQSDSIIDHFATNADPTEKKTHTQWIVNRYKKKQFRQEDHPRIRQALSDFEKYKGKLEKKDINQYKTLDEIEDAVQPHRGEAASKKEEKRQIKTEGADLVHNDTERGVTVHHIKTEDAACQYGKGTKWCTAADRNNMFNEYNKDGPIFVVQHGGRKYQFHTKSEQLMDEKDKPVKMSELHPDIQRSIAASEHPDIEHANMVFRNPEFEMTDERAQKYVNHPQWLLRMRVAAKAPGLFVNDSDPYVRGMVAGNKEHAGKLIDDEDSDVREIVAGHPEYAEKLMKDTDSRVRAAVARRHPEHADKLINDESNRVRRAVATHSEHAGKLVNDPDLEVRAEVARHPEHASKLVKDPEPEVRDTAHKTLYNTRQRGRA